MSYYLYKLQFTTPLHVGESRLANGLESAQLNICADTLFSAICHSIIGIEGEGALNAFVDKVRANNILFSDTFPYKQDKLYIPKPYITSKSNREIDISKRKLMKKLSYIPVETINTFLNSVAGKDIFDPETITNDFCLNTVDTKVNLTEGPYSVASVSFFEGCGLYGIVKGEKPDIEYIINHLKMLGLSGIGGKISSGYGKFKVIDVINLEEEVNSQYGLLLSLLKNTNSDYYISLTTSLPTDSELERAIEGAAYKMVRRGGFMYSTKLNRPLKKQTQYCFYAGSVFRTRYEGDVYNVATKDAPHPAYRYLKPIFLGVNI